MKRTLLLTGMAIACLLNSCSKKSAPTPNPPVDPTKPTETVAITDFSPKTAKPGVTITITGKGFGSDPALVKVAIGDNSTYSQPVSVTPTTITVQTNLATSTGKVRIFINGSTVYSGDDFTALLPDLRVVGYDADAQLSHQVNIHGQGFGTDTNKIGVSFGGTTPVKPNYISTSGLTIGAIAPRYAQEGKITVTFNGQTATCDQLFMLDMSMRDFSPKTFSSGDTVKITGVKFTDIGDMKVSFNTTTNSITKPIKVTATEMLVIVPFNATSGFLTIGTNLGAIGNTSADKFTFIPTVYFSNAFTPASGKVNDVIRINGDFVGVDISTIGVSFGGSKPVQPASITGPDIYVKVPSDAKTGNITISRTGYKSFTAPFIFMVLP